jgi:hypothetical protein
MHGVQHTAVTQCNLPSFFLSFFQGWSTTERFALRLRGRWLTGTGYLRSDLTDGQTDRPVWASGAEFSQCQCRLDVIRIRVHVARSNFSAGIILTLSRIIPALHLKCISINIIIVHVPGLVTVTEDFSMLPSLTALQARVRFDSRVHLSRLVRMPSLAFHVRA